MSGMPWEVEMSGLLWTDFLPWTEEAVAVLLSTAVPMQTAQLTLKSAVRFQLLNFSSHTQLPSVARLEGVFPSFTGPFGWLPFSHLSLRSSGEIWRTHVLSELSPILLRLRGTCRTLADVLILLPAYFSSSGLSSRCSSKCFLLRPFTTLLQNRSCAPASALQIFNENIIHVPLSTSLEMAHFPHEHRFNSFRIVYPFILFSLTFLPFTSAFLWRLIMVLAFWLLCFS